MTETRILTSLSLLVLLAAAVVSMKIERWEDLLRLNEKRISQFEELLREENNQRIIQNTWPTWPPWNPTKYIPRTFMTPVDERDPGVSKEFGGMTPYEPTVKTTKPWPTFKPFPAVFRNVIPNEEGASDVHKKVGGLTPYVPTTKTTLPIPSVKPFPTVYPNMISNDDGASDVSTTVGGMTPYEPTVKTTKPWPTFKPFPAV